MIDSAQQRDQVSRLEPVRLDVTRVVVLTTDSPLTRKFAAGLPPDRLAGIIWENRGARERLRLWQRRVKRHGPVTTVSRLAALGLDHLVHRFRSGRPGAAMPAPIAGVTTRSVNHPCVVEAVRGLQPTLVVVAGTTLLGPALLDALSQAVVVNVHVGRTPAYRGTHGGAWAVIEGRLEDVVTTVHLVDDGVDMGRPLVYLPVNMQPTMTGLAHAQLEVGLDWLRHVITVGGLSLIPVQDVPASLPLRYPPTLRAWWRFRGEARRSNGSPAMNKGC